MAVEVAGPEAEALEHERTAEAKVEVQENVEPSVSGAETTEVEVEVEKHAVLKAGPEQSAFQLGAGTQTVE